MDSTMIAGIIGGIFTLISPIITLFIKYHFDNRRILSIPYHRRKALQGRWLGAVNQREAIEGVQKDFQIDAVFTIRGKLIHGRAVYHVSPQDEVLVFSGGFYDQRYLKLEYENENKNVIQYGTAMLELSSNAKKLEGEFLGYGIDSERIISGKMFLKQK